MKENERHRPRSTILRYIQARTSLVSRRLVIRIQDQVDYVALMDVYLDTIP